MEVDERSDKKSDTYRQWMSAHARLKNEFMEDEKYHNLVTWHSYGLLEHSVRTRAGMCTDSETGYPSPYYPRVPVTIAFWACSQ